MNQPDSEKLPTSEKKSGRGKADKAQTRFFLEFNNDAKNLKMILEILVTALQKEHGRELTLKDIVAHALALLTPKDLERINENALPDMERMERMLAEYNQSQGTNLDMGEFLAKKLKAS